MLLSTEDIERLERKGYDRNFFARCDLEGYVTLRNYSGYCVFYDVQKKRCKVRAIRPLGCRIYPVIYDEEKGIVVDNICPAQNTVAAKAKHDGFALVVDMAAETPNSTPVVLYSNGDNDLTDPVMAQLNAGAPPEEAKPADTKK